MNHDFSSKQFWAVLSLMLMGLVLLTACSTEINPLQTDVNPASPINTQTISTSGEWEAATFYSTTCASCHGATGGGSTFAPALNQENIRTADTTWLVETISYGRSGAAMPAWSVESGGPLNSDQIADMAAFLQTGNWETDEDIAQQQPGFPMSSGMMGGMGNGRNGMMGGGMIHNGMANDRQP